jgi:hypothetical protein
VKEILIVDVLRLKPMEEIKYSDHFSTVRTTGRLVEGRQKLASNINTRKFEIYQSSP